MSRTHQILNGRSPGRTLLQVFLSYLLLSCYLLSVLVACGGCTEVPAAEVTPLTGAGQHDTLCMTLHFSSPLPLETLDIFVYENGGIERLLEHQRIHPEADSLVMGYRVPCRVIAVGNAPAQFNAEALSICSSFETLTIPFDEMQQMRSPTLSAETMVEEPGGVTTITLQRVCCSVVIRSISRNEEGFSLFESPRVRLTSIALGCELLRWSGFREADVGESEWHELPCDIGFYTQYPGLELCCFPSDAPAGGGTRWPSVQLEYEEDGEVKSREWRLGAVHRAETVYLDLML